MNCRIYYENFIKEAYYIPVDKCSILVLWPRIVIG
jgi:hypothetical protein